MSRAGFFVATTVVALCAAACSSGSSAGSGNPASTGDGGSGMNQDGSGSATFDQFQLHNLEVVNMYRATLKIAPLALDAKICAFALAGTNELTMDHTPHAHFVNASNDGSIWSAGFSTPAGENQGDPNGWTVLAPDPTTNELDQIDAIQKVMFDEGPGAGEAHGHYTNMMNPQFTRLGVGLVEVAGHLYLTNDFSG